ncbi:MAG: hypothetical protein ACLUVC_13380 [Longibaculum sp.]
MKKIFVIVLLMICSCFSMNRIYAKEIITGLEAVMIPNVGESIAIYHVEEGYVFESFQDEGIIFSCDGRLTLTKEAKEKIITLTAVHGSKKYKKQVSLYYSWTRKDPKFKDYQVKESLEPIQSYGVDIHFFKSIKIGIVFVGGCIFIGYIYKRRRNG